MRFTSFVSLTVCKEKKNPSREAVSVTRKNTKMLRRLDLRRR